MLGKRFVQFCAAVAAAVAWSSAAEASLIGNTVNCSIVSGPYQCSTASAVVGDGIEFFIQDSPGGTTLIAFDIFDMGVTVFNPTSDAQTFLNGEGFLLDILNPLISLVDPNPTVGNASGVGGGVNAQNINGNDTRILIVGSLTFQPGGTFDLRYPNLVDNSPISVPLPATLPLFGVGLAGLGLIAARRRKAA